MSTRVHIVVGEGLLARVDEARGDVSRSRWIVRALEKALGGVAASGSDSGSDPVAGSVPVRPASPRASENPGWVQPPPLSEAQRAEFRLPKFASRRQP